MGALRLRLHTTDGLPITCDPRRAGVAIADLMTGMYSTVGILGVLRGKKIL